MQRVHMMNQSGCEAWDCQYWKCISFEMEFIFSFFCCCCCCFASIRLKWSMVKGRNAHLFCEKCEKNHLNIVHTHSKCQNETRLTVNCMLRILKTQAHATCVWLHSSLICKDSLQDGEKHVLCCATIQLFGLDLTVNVHS